MGWNQGYAIFESTVVGAYDLGVLSLDLLKVLCEPYRDTGIDSGGSADLVSKDGLTAEEIVIKLAAPKKFKLLDTHRRRIAEYPADWDAQTAKQQDDWEAYGESRCEIFGEITGKLFGW